MKVAPSRDEEALLSGDAAITVGLLTVVTAVERFEAHQAKTLERRAELLEGILESRGVAGMGQDGDPPYLPDQPDSLPWRGQPPPNISPTVGAQRTVQGA